MDSFQPANRNACQLLSHPHAFAWLRHFHGGHGKAGVTYPLSGDRLISWKGFSLQITGNGERVLYLKKENESVKTSWPLSGDQCTSSMPHFLHISSVHKSGGRNADREGKGGLSAVLFSFVSH